VIESNLSKRPAQVCWLWSNEVCRCSSSNRASFNAFIHMPYCLDNGTSMPTCYFTYCRHFSVAAWLICSCLWRQHKPKTKQILTVTETILSSALTIYSTTIIIWHVVVVVIAQQLFSYRQLPSLRKSATAAGLSHRSCTVSCVGCNVM